jgi:hypothetical protein
LALKIDKTSVSVPALSNAVISGIRSAASVFSFAHVVVN